MTWLDNPIDGQQSVAANKAPLNNAFQYISDKMQLDHFWDTGKNAQAGDLANANLDGHHAFVQMPKFESGGNPADPTLDTDMDGVLYVKEKSATDAPDLQMQEPFYIANDGTRDQILQCGFRALVYFEGRNSNGNATIKYAHNISTVARTAEGKYTFTFTVQMPTENYIVLSGAIRNSSSASSLMTTGVSPSTTVAPVQSVTRVILSFSRNTASDLEDPLTGWIAVVGG